MFFVYVLYSVKFNRRYVGMTNNIDRRLNEHNNGRQRSTKAFKPWIIIHSEQFETRLEARKREVYLKSGIGREWLNKNFNQK